MPERLSPLPKGQRPDISLIGDAHVERYLATDGAEGHIWNGATCLVLTVKGRKTGKQKSFALIYGKDGDDHLVVASKGGAPDHPGWYKNLTEHPDVEVQVLGDCFQATARTATAAEKPRLWKIMTEGWPNYDQYQENTDRDIPVVVLERK
jgi:deazaflavin-dependent oxidoreductase (nitroreductase family)